MPVTKSAIKKLRQDKRKTAFNVTVEKQLTDAVKAMRRNKKVSLSETYSKIDKASKKGVIHPNKAARLKSQVAKLAPSKPLASKKSTKTAPKKTVKSKAKKASK